MLIFKAINKSVAQILFCIIFVLLHALSLFAHEKGRMVAFDSHTTAIVRSKIYYPVNKIEIYEDYMSNSEELEYIKLHLANSPRIDSITIYSYASPEGRYKFNKWLAEERGKTAKRYILEHIPEYKHIPDSIVRIAPTAENVRSEKYPIITPIYAVTYEGQQNENVDKLLQWILSEEGQEIVEKTGYVGN